MTVKIYVVYYSMYGHILKLAEEIKKGAESIEGVEVKLWQVAETLPEEVLAKMHAPLKGDAPIISPDDLSEADGILFGFPTRFGMMASQFKAFFDSTGGLWKSGALVGKPAGLFLSTATQGGGQETTAYYSMYGHILKLADEMKKGAESVQGVEVKLWQVAETLPQAVLEKMHAPPKGDAPIISPDDLIAADGFLFGFPTRFGMMCAQFKALFDATGGLWQAGGLVGKPAGVFYSVGTQGGGQETTALTTVTQLVHHGMIFVPVGYTFGSGMFDVENVKGGSPYGAGTFAGADGSRQPSEVELKQAFHQGQYMAGVVKKLKG